MFDWVLNTLLSDHLIVQGKRLALQNRVILLKMNFYANGFLEDFYISEDAVLAEVNVVYNRNW